MASTSSTDVCSFETHVDLFFSKIIRLSVPFRLSLVTQRAPPQPSIGTLQPCEPCGWPWEHPAAVAATRPKAYFCWPPGNAATLRGVRRRGTRPRGTVKSIQPLGAMPPGCTPWRGPSHAPRRGTARCGILATSLLADNGTRCWQRRNAHALDHSHTHADARERGDGAVTT